MTLFESLCRLHLSFVILADVRLSRTRLPTEQECSRSPGRVQEFGIILHSPKGRAHSHASLPGRLRKRSYLSNTLSLGYLIEGIRRNIFEALAHPARPTHFHLR